jgi:hypothetical protein
LTPAPNVDDAIQSAESDENLSVGQRAVAKQKLHPRLIVCEGNSDEAIIQALLRVHGIDGVQVEYAGGSGNFSVLLRAARGKKFNRVLLISDGDENPEASFQLVRQKIVEAGYTAPENRRQPIEPEGKNPGVEILMLPWDQEKGCTETVCLPAFAELYPNQFECLEAYSACTGADGWHVSQVSEMKVHCLLGCTQLPNPRVGLKIFASRTECPLNFNHDCFGQLVEHLRLFAGRPVTVSP